MRLRFGIPFTIALALLASGASWVVGFNVYYLLVAGSAVWIGVDSRRIRIREYATQLALPALPLMICGAFFWPFFFPWYLRVRGRIARGEIAPGRVEQRLAFAIFVIVATLAVAGLGFVSVSRSMKGGVLGELFALAQGIGSEFKLPNSFNLAAGGTVLTITLPRDQVPQAKRDSVALAVARYALLHFARRSQLRTVRVVFATSRQIGAITYTSTSEAREWSVEELAGARRRAIELPEIATVLSPQTLAGRWRPRACDFGPSGEGPRSLVAGEGTDTGVRIAFDTVGVFTLSQGEARGPGVVASFRLLRDTLTIAGGRDTTVATGVRVSPHFLLLTTAGATRHLRCGAQGANDGAHFLLERSAR